MHKTSGALRRNLICPQMMMNMAKLRMQRGMMEKQRTPNRRRQRQGMIVRFRQLMTSLPAMMKLQSSARRPKQANHAAARCGDEASTASRVGEPVGIV